MGTNQRLPVEEVSDIYPSRAGEPARLIDRQDPVVYAPAKTGGPIEPYLLERYEQQGFPVLEGFFNRQEVEVFKQEPDRPRHDEALKAAGNITPYPRSNVFFAYNAINNRVRPPYGGQPSRPEYLYSRKRIEPLKPQVNRFVS